MDTMDLSRKLLFYVLNALTISISVIMCHEPKGICDSVCQCNYMHEIFINCNHRSLQQVPIDIPENATTLDLSFNDISQLTVNSFPKLPKLQRLDMRLCDIRKVDEYAFSQLPSLLEIHLDHNALTSLENNTFDNCNSLEWLSLEHNQLEELDELVFNGLRLLSLSLQDNRKLVSLNTNLFKNSSVETLTLDRCGINVLTAETLQPLAKSLRNLLWSYSTKPLFIENKLFAGFHLKMLNLIEDGLTSLDFLTTDFCVQTLDLSHNNFRTIIISNLKALAQTENLVLKSSGIHQIACSDRAPNVYVAALQQLDLSDNALTTLDNDVFSAMVSLKTLILRGNRLNTLSVDLAPVLRQLQSLDLCEQTFDCDCRMEWFRRASVVQTSGLKLNCSDSALNGFDSEFTCSSPNITALDTIVKSNLAGDGNALDVVCVATGAPLPSIRWKYVEGSVAHEKLRHNYAVMSTLRVRNVQDCHRVQCVAENIAGTEFKIVSLCSNIDSVSTVQGQMNSSESGTHAHSRGTVGWVVAATLTVLIIICLTFILIKCNKNKRSMSRVNNRRSYTKANSQTCLVESDMEDIVVSVADS